MFGNVGEDIGDLFKVALGVDAVAHRRGSMFALAPAKCFRGLAWLSCGALAEAEGNLRDSLWAVMTTSQQVGVPVVAAYLADTLMEQGNLDEAEAVLKAANRLELSQAGYWAWPLGSRARLLTLQERIHEGVRCAARADAANRASSRASASNSLKSVVPRHLSNAGGPSFEPVVPAPARRSVRPGRSHPQRAAGS